MFTAAPAVAPTILDQTIFAEKKITVTWKQEIGDAALYTIGGAEVVTYEVEFWISNTPLSSFIPIVPNAVTKEFSKGH